MATSKSEIINKAREITGNKVGRGAAEMDVPDPAVEHAMTPSIREINAAIGTASSKKEKTFTTTAGVQDYDIATVIGADVFSIDEVYRSSAYVPDRVLEQVDPMMLARGFASAPTIEPGLQRDVFDTITARIRFEQIDRQNNWEVAPGNKLRLMPPPVTSDEIVKVVYTSTDFSFETIPGEAEYALVCSACVAILDGMLNRVGGNPMFSKQFNREQDYRAVIENLRKQRDYYKSEYDGEVSRLKRAG